MKGVLIEPCPHDTRTHSSSPAPVPEKTNGGDPWNCTDLGIECPDPEQEWCDWPCDKWLEYHDADVARKVREQVLDALEAEMKRRYADNPNPILPIEQGEHQCTGFWLTRLESLRSGEGVQR